MARSSRAEPFGIETSGEVTQILLAINKNDVELDLVYFNWQDIRQRGTRLPLLQDVRFQLRDASSVILPGNHGGVIAGT